MRSSRLPLTTGTLCNDITLLQNEIVLYSSGPYVGGLVTTCAPPADVCCLEASGPHPHLIVMVWPKPWPKGAGSINAQCSSAQVAQLAAARLVMPRT